MFYYVLCYFRGRKDTGSIYIKIDKDLDSFIDDNDFLSYLITHKIIDEQTANEIIEIYKITKEEYNDMTGGN